MSLRSGMASLSPGIVSRRPPIGKTCALAGFSTARRRLAHVSVNDAEVGERTFRRTRCSVPSARRMRSHNYAQTGTMRQSELSPAASGTRRRDGECRLGAIDCVCVGDPSAGRDHRWTCASATLSAGRDHRYTSASATGSVDDLEQHGRQSNSTESTARPDREPQRPSLVDREPSRTPLFHASVPITRPRLA